MDRLDLAQEPRSVVPGPSARFGKSLAVVIGVDVYGEGIAPLRSAVADAKAIAAALERDHGFETWRLLDGDAELPHLLALLRERLPAALEQGDRLVLYFAGHGIALDGDAGPAGYLLPAGAQRAERDGFLPMHVVHGELARLPVRHALIILDCCFAGTFRWSSLRDVVPESSTIYRERYDRYLESAAWQVLTSASSDQLALDMLANDRGEGEGVHSPFALALLDGLAGAADYTRDNVITADELAMYARERVASVAESVGRRQVPQLFPLDRHDAGQFVFQVPGRAVALAAAPPLDEAQNPYRGLRSFLEEDRGLFFGRDAVVERLALAAAARPLTVVAGPSGSGKSSLVHAGLVPALRARGFTVLPSQRPARAPLDALDAWTRALGAEPIPGAPVRSWATAVAARAAAHPDRPWLVIVDQLEELLTHRTAEADRLAFLGALADALRAAPQLHVIVTVRSDAEPQLHDTALAPWWAAGRFAVPAMTRDELRQIIERPATAAVLHFEPSRLVDRLIDDVALVPAPLPLLSFALSELYRRSWARWQAGDRDRGLREADYDEMGSVARALTQRATAVHDALVAEDAQYATTIRNVFTRMVALVGGELARRRVPRHELAYEDPAEDRRVDDVLLRFHDARLISLGTEPAPDGGASAYAEPTHDELVRGWAQVRRWLDELDAPAGTRALLGALADAVRPWRTQGRADSYLWSDARVELLSALGRSRRLALNADEARFVARAARRRRSQRRRLVGGLLAVIVVLAVAAGVALSQRDQAQQNAARAEENAAREKLAQQRASSEAQRATSLLARMYQEAGHQFLLDGHRFKALPFLVAARREGEAGTPLRMLFWTATRALPRTPPLDHQRAVTSAAFSPDGARVVTGGFDHTARVWDAATGRPLLPPLQHGGILKRVTWSSDGKRIVTASLDHRVRIWDAAAGTLLVTIQDRSAPSVAVLSPDGARLLTANNNDTAQLWDAATGKPLGPRFQHAGAVTDAAWSPDGARVVTASRDYTAQVWDAATGKPLAPPLRHASVVNSAAWSPDGARVITASTDKTARVWDAATGESIGPPLLHRENVRAASFSPDGALVVTASDDKTACVWDTGAGRFQPLEHQRAVTGAAWSPDGTRVVTASTDGTARIWDAATGRPLSPPLEHTDEILHVAWSPDGARIVTASRDKTARVWDAASSGPLSRSLAHTHAVKTAAWSPDGARVVTGGDDHAAHIFAAATGKSLGPPLEHRGSVNWVAWSPDGARVVTASADDTARIWSAATGKELATLQHQNKVWRAAWSPDGTRVVTASFDKTARIWSAATGKELVTLQHRGEVRSAAWSPDGTRVVTASADNTARVWDAATGRALPPPLEHRGPVWSVAWSPDGTRVVTASADNTARVWDAATGAQRARPLEHQGAVHDASFSPDGSLVVTASADKTARVWDAATGMPASPAFEHRDNVSSAAFSPDGASIVTANDDGTASVWSLATHKLLGAPFQHRELVWTAAFSPDGTRVVTASDDQTAQIWELPIASGSLAEWDELAERSPYLLSSGVLVPRLLRPAP
ncbi:MAG TPA: caspase family protein [Kofleriaceae bacterium]|nr:caspase family protein [Kofleriaceae bacterium]